LRHKPKPKRKPFSGFTGNGSTDRYHPMRRNRMTRTLVSSVFRARSEQRARAERRAIENRRINVQRHRRL
jgi:hypothetical protein